MEPSQDQPPSSEANEQSEQRPDLLAESHPGQVSVTAVEDAPAPIPQDQAPFDVDVSPSCRMRTYMVLRENS